MADAPSVNWRDGYGSRLAAVQGQEQRVAARWGRGPGVDELVGGAVVPQAAVARRACLLWVGWIGAEGAAAGAPVGDQLDRRQAAAERAAGVGQLELDRVGPAGLAGVDRARIIDRHQEATEGVIDRVAHALADGVAHVIS